MSLFYLSDLRSVWINNGQTWAQCENKVQYGLKPTIYLSLDLRSSSCSTMTVGILSFAPLIYACTKQISSKKAREISYMADLHLQSPPTDLQLEFGTGAPELETQIQFSFFLDLDRDILQCRIFLHTVSD